MPECKKCSEQKPITDFYAGRRECKPCNLAAKRAWYRRNREKAIERAKEWRDKNRTRYLKYQRAYNEANRELRRHEDRARHLRKTYGITQDAYVALLWKQATLCAICGRPDEAGLHIDHDHASGVVRGLLCGKCNKAIGLMDDEPDRMKAAAEYLRADRTSRRLQPPVF